MTEFKENVTPESIKKLWVICCIIPIVIVLLAALLVYNVKTLKRGLSSTETKVESIRKELFNYNSEQNNFKEDFRL